MPDPRASDSTIHFQRLRLAGDVISDSLAFVREHFADLGRGVLYIAGPFLLAAAVASSFFQGSIFGGDWLNPNADPFAVFDMFGPAYFLSVLLTFFATLLLSAVGYAYVLLYMEDHDRQITVPVLWDEVKAILPAIVTTSIGIWLVMMLGGLLNIIPCLGTLVWLGGIIYFFPALSIVLTARLTDEDNLMDAFRRSRDLVKGYWGQTFGVVIMAYLIYFAAAMVLSIPGMMVGATVGFLGGMDGEGISQFTLLIASLFSVLAYAFIVLLPVAFTMQYYNLVERQEGPDLDDRIDAIAAGASDYDDASPDFDATVATPESSEADDDVDRWRRPAEPFDDDDLRARDDDASDPR